MLEQTAVPKLARSTALRYFSEVAECGSFRGASEALRIAASAINRQVSNLEADLGVKLFERPRGRAGLHLTEAGRILQFRLRSAINELRIANEEIVALQGLQRGHVNIGVNDVLANDLLPTLISDFRSIGPKITYKITVDNSRSLLGKLKDGEIDLAVGYNFPSNEGLLFRAVNSIKMYLIAPKNHILAKHKSVSLLDLSGSDILLPDKTFILQQIVEVALRASKVRANLILETNSLPLISSLVERGVGVSIVAGRIELGENQARVVHVEIKDALLPHSELSCCVLPYRSLSAAAEAFIEKIASAIKSGKYV
ncbi:LysR family transcriptional regulator [Rhizobium sp. ARZ01]|uniref:LysR family transcriptional regulator n=1 Tax=Rhizobium sp. ARZ01 TaxID=2769313 RepID=UPI001784E2AA|nr:LysR family transcriptional regulator [Rhizobium sp. ARZ01]MBD9375422.1 LysR family transcriptional regulator [Rhizobium sp. ARZ01]